jgi:hypothetical protein
MQIKQKQNKKLLESKSATVALRKMATEKSKQAVASLESELELLKAEATANEKKLELRAKYSSRLDETIQTKKDEVMTQTKILQSGSDQKEAQNNGPDVMEYILQKAEIYELQETIKTLERKIEIAVGNQKLRSSDQYQVSRRSTFISLDPGDVVNNHQKTICTNSQLLWATNIDL